MTEMDSNGNDGFGVGIFVGVVLTCIALFIISCVAGDSGKTEYIASPPPTEYQLRVDWIEVCTDNFGRHENLKMCMDFYPRGSVPVSNPYQSYTRIDER
jgi:hypothetical protein